MKTLGKCFCGFVLGWLIYMVAMVLTVYDGVMSLIFQPFMAALFSGLSVVLALVFGLALRAPKIREAWSSAGWGVLFITAAAVAVMILHAQLGLQTEFVNPGTKEKMKTISPAAGALCYFLAIFPVVNLPAKRQSKMALQAASAPSR